MKRILFALAVAAAATGLNAEVLETVTMRDGNMYSGYISEQTANGEITFRADTSVVYVPMVKIDRIAGHKTSSGERADIYLRHDILDTVAVVEAVLSEAVTDTAAVAGYESEYSGTYDGATDVIRDVEILEEGSVVKYRDAKPRDLRLLMRDVLLITRPARDSSMANGLLDEIVTRGGQTYTGRIVSNEPGKAVRINSGGRIYMVALKDIAVQRRVAADPEEAIVRQSPLLDNVYLRKGGEVLRDVVFTEQNYAEGTFDVVDRNNVTIRRRLADISRILKSVNRDYAPRREFDFDKDSVYINRTAVEAMPYLRKDGVITVKLPEEEVPVFARDHGRLTVECADNTPNRRTLLVPVIMRGGKELTVNLADLIEKNIPASTQEINPKNGILSRDYYLGAGYYALVNTDAATLILFRVR